ncbi:4-hydroxy-3-methylbut-2-enyl diphosphate reductase, partial [Acinetobacter guillouiae]
AERRGLKVFDATCPLVTKVHIEVTKYAREGNEAILIGHEGHPEVEGTMGQYDKKKGGEIYLVEDEEDVASLTVHHPEKIAFVTQTNLSIDDTAKVIDA